MCSVSKGMKPSRDVLWEPAEFINIQKTQVRLCVDGKILPYDPSTMRQSGAWFYESNNSECFPVFKKETNEVCT